jgi:hypothetical protein
MPYIQRDGLNAIIGLYANPQEGYAEEFLPDDNAEVIDYLTPPTIDEIDTKSMNSALTQPGSVTRAMGELLFKIMKGVEPIPQASLTKNQFVQKLKALMRNGS